MKKYLLVLGLLSLIVAVGCGGEKESAEAQAEGTSEAIQVAAHDCDGGCGMKAVPMDQLTEKDGKFYCAGCIKKAEAGDHSGHDHSGHDHSGHDHN